MAQRVNSAHPILGASVIFIATLLASIAYPVAYEQTAEFLPNAPQPNQFNSFGRSVAISGNTVVVAEKYGSIGAEVNAGNIYQRNTLGTWAQVSVAPGSASNPDVDVDGDTLIVAGRNAFTGLFEVYDELSTGNWSNSGDFTVADYASGDHAFALSSDVAIVGSVESRSGATPASAHIIERGTGGAWTESALLRPEGMFRPPPGFGSSVDIDGDVAIAGAFGDSSNGAAYVFHKTSAGNWEQVARLVADDGAPDDLFGWSVAIDGNIALVGAPHAGAAYVFHRGSTATWDQVAKLEPSDGDFSSMFGWSVDLDSQRAIVGAPDAVSFTLMAVPGTAYVYKPQASGSWTEIALLNSDGAAAGDKFGWSVELSKRTAIVGAPFRDSTSADAGAAYVFELVPEPSSLSLFGICCFWIGLRIRRPNR
jgi:hypothetical protein